MRNQVSRLKSNSIIFYSKLSIAALLLCVFALAQCASRRAVATTLIPDDSTNTFLADPTIFPANGNFYLYGTVDRGANGFLAYTSSNLKDWQLAQSNGGYALKKGESFGTTGFWAPQVVAQNGSYYMAYVANENIAIAKSTNPAGPFTQTTQQPLAAPVKQIDPFVFVDDDGKKYLYHVRLTGGNKIFVAQMTDDFSAILPETLHECITATEPWENTAKAAWPVTEGPSVLKHNGVYYLVYTANDFRNPDYAVGYATSSSPLGPWKKYDGNPIIQKNVVGINGTGHGDFFFKGKDLYYVFHTHYSNDKPTPRRTALIKMHFAKTDDGIDKLVAEQKTFRYLHKKVSND